jgi:hypothetical protein
MVMKRSVRNAIALGKGIDNSREFTNDRGFPRQVYAINGRCGGPANVVTVGALFEGCNHFFIVFCLSQMKEWSTEICAEDRDSSNKSLEITFNEPILIYLVHEHVN